jgi:GTP:adenosylcobinamide-phosphate guanylyltransferase
MQKDSDKSEELLDSSKSNIQLTIIVQAGGRGSRLRHYTWNKPKCLVSINGKPLLYHLFNKYKNAKYLIIGDHCFEQLETYLKVNPPEVEYKLIRTTDKGTLAGISTAIKYAVPSKPVLLVWSDLIINDVPTWPSNAKLLPIVCKTSAFTCRWSINSDGKLIESTSDQTGIPGIFYFQDYSYLQDIPESGEFVKWFSLNVSEYLTHFCNSIEELGEFNKIETNNDRAGFSRFFNKVEIKDNYVIKTVIDPEYNRVHENEIAWYREAEMLGFNRIPKVINHHPLTMERIIGQHGYQFTDLTERERRAILADQIDSLSYLHSLRKTNSNIDELNEVYIKKTHQRVMSVAELIPNFSSPSFTINGKKCRNIFSDKYSDVLPTLGKLLIAKEFTPIHGDPTFSNTLIDDKLRVWFIDPRGYFCKPGIMGDPLYDYAKVYYSAVGGYDLFNRRKFKLHIDGESIEIIMPDPYFARQAEKIFSEYFDAELGKIKIIHGLLWLALSGYAKDDIDSIIGSFYNGLYWLEDSVDLL